MYIHFSFLLLLLFLLFLYCYYYNYYNYYFHYWLPLVVTVLAGVLSLLLLSFVVMTLLKYQHHFLYQPLFLSFSYVSCYLNQYNPPLFFLRDHNGNKVTQLFYVIPAITPYHNYDSFQF